MPSASLLGYGISVPPADRHFDPVPLLSIVAALAITRLVIRARLTPINAALAAFGGALWAFMIPGWGPLVPTFIAAITVFAARVVTRNGHPESSA